MTKIKQARLNKGLKAIELSILTGLTKTSISLFESGKNKPSELSLHKIAKVLECSVDDLREDE